MRSAVAHRHAEALGRADDDVGTPFAGRREQRQRQNIGGDDDEPAACVHRVDERTQVADVAVCAGVLKKHGERIGARGVRRMADHDLDAERRGARAHDVLRLREHVVGDEQARAPALAHPLAKRHRLGGGGCFVQHRGVRNRHSGEVANHRLEIDERLEPALRNLRLIRRVRGVPRGIFEDVAHDDAGRMRAVVALSDHRVQHPVLGGDGLQSRERLELRHRRGKRQRRRTADGSGNDRVHQCRARPLAEHGEHRRLIGRRGADVARDERAAVLEGRERRCRVGGLATGIVHRDVPLPR